MINDQVLALGNNETILKYKFIGTIDGKEEIVRVYYPDRSEDFPSSALVSIMKKQKKQYSDIAIKLDKKCRKIQREIKKDTACQIKNLKFGGAIDLLMASAILPNIVLRVNHSLSATLLAITFVGNSIFISHLLQKGSDINHKRTVLDELKKNRLFLAHYLEFEDYNCLKKAEAECNGESFNTPIELDNLDQHSLFQLNEALRESNYIRKINNEKARDNLYIEKDDFTISAPKTLGKVLPFRVSPYDNLNSNDDTFC